VTSTGTECFEHSAGSPAVDAVIAYCQRLAHDADLDRVARVIGVDLDEASLRG